MTRLERHGDRNLRLDDAKSGQRSFWIVRIYYRSQAGETLYFNSGPHYVTVAESLVRQYGKSHWIDAEKPTDAIGAQMFDVRKEPPPVAFDARLVVLPSQQRSES